MKSGNKAGKKAKGAGTSQVRATISFPAAVYESLELIAKEKKVSLAWVVRDATERYVSDKWPLFASVGKDSA